MNRCSASISAAASRAPPRKKKVGMHSSGSPRWKMRIQRKANNKPVAPSPRGYLMEMGRWQLEQRAFRQSQLIMGMFSHGLMA